MTPREADSDLGFKNREAKIASQENDQIGVCLYLSPADLELLGVDIGDAKSISYTIDSETGQLRVESAAEVDQ